MTVFSPWYVEPEYWVTGYAEGDGFYQLSAELQKVAPSAVIELFELDLTAALHGVTETYRFHAGANLNANGPMVWNANTYLRFPVEADGFEYSGNGQLPRPKIRIANMLGTITTILLSLPDGLEGAKVTRIRTLARYLDAVNFVGAVNPYGTPDPTAEFPREIYYIDRKTAENRDVVEFELAAAFDLAGVRGPKRQCVANICQWEYRSPECGYTGTLYFDESDQLVANINADVCGKRLSSCEARFNQFVRTATLTSGSTSVTLNSTANIIATMPVAGLGIPASTTVTAVNSGTVITISQAATISSNLSRTGTASATAASMTVSSAAGIIAGATVSGTYMPSGTVVSSVAGTTLTLNQRPYSIARGGSYYSLAATKYITIDTTGLSVGMYVWGTNGISGTITGIVTFPAPRITLSNYGTLPTGGLYTTAQAAVTLYFMPASPAALTYTFQQADIPLTFRANPDGLPFGSFPGIGAYFS